MNSIYIIQITISVILLFLLHYFMYIWTKELENKNCDCSDIIHRKIINYGSIVFFIILIFNYINIITNNIFIKPSIFISILLTTISIIYLSIIIDYIRKLKEKQCECSEDWKRKYGYIFSIIYLILSVLSLVIITMFLIFGGYPILKKIEDNIKK
jgi:hypothetical protein